MAAGSSGARMLRDLVSLKNEQMLVRIKILIITDSVRTVRLQHVRLFEEAVKVSSCAVRLRASGQTERQGRHLIQCTS